MDCASCGRANRAGAKFCNACGRPLAARCPACGSESQPDSQFCDACGAPLVASPAGATDARKIVTIVFADLIGSTALHERLDAESARRFMERYYRAMRFAVEAHGGTVTQLLGDGVKAVFGAPRVAEDDAIRAVRAAVEMQRAFRALADEQLAAVGQTGLRVAVNTGEVVANDASEIIGDPVNVAARLQEEARDGSVVIGEATRRLVAELVTLAPLGSFALKGRSEAVAAYRVVSLERPAGAPAIAFVGREDELRRIRAVYDTAVATRAARLAVVLGSPGLGKSRLIDEFSRRLGDAAAVLMAHCEAAGGATFAPLADALRGLLRIDTGASGDVLREAIKSALPGDAPERDRIADGVAALLAGTPASPEEIFFVVRRGLAALALVRPVVLAIDDIQWAEPLLLDLIEHLVQWGSDAPLLVLAAARPELRDTRSSLATPGGLVSDVVTLSGLDAGAAARLAANVIGAEALPAAIAGRVLATSEGNPLFVGELVRMLVHDGALRREGDRWTAGVEVAGLEMPPTIHALLAARIERLRPEERTVLERAAVIGRHFSRTSLAQLLPREISDLDARLESLRRSELVEPDTGWFLGEPVLRFHHVLIRDAAYRRLLKNTRAELHGRFADWLEARAAGSVEHDEMLGWHLEQAHQLLLELAPIDAQGRALGERAARHLAAAGRRALARDDLTPAASLLERALARLDAADPARADLTLDWCEALLSAGDVVTAVRAIAELGRFAPASDRLRAWHTCFSGQLAVLTDPKALRASSDAVEAAAAALTSAGDAAGEAKAHAVHALVLAQLGKIGACETALDKALAAARRARDRRRANAVLAGAPVAALWGPSPVTRASGRCLDVVRVLRITQGAPAVEAVALRCQAVLETLRGRTEAARRMIASSRRMVEELGITQRVLEADVFAGLIELLEGDAAAAERCLHSAYEGLRAQGLGIDAAQAGALLGRALLAQGRVAEAEAISIESEALAGDSFKAAIAWRGVRAEALAARGEHAGAIEFARAGVEIAAATDDLLDHADARQALAVALRAAGRRAEADAEEKRAVELWEAKGATLLAERARSGAARSSELPRSPGPSAFPAQTVRRRLRPNAATAVMARSAAAVEARDAEAVTALHSDAAEYVDHAAGGVSYGREGFLASFRSLSQSRDLTFQREPLAVLGDSLALARRLWSASGVASTTFDVAAYEREALNLFEVDGESLVRRLEIFAPDRLGNAIARLYERYAELLPDGEGRTRAAATARSVAALPGSPDHWPFAPDAEATDHRTVGFGSLRGADAVVRAIRALIQLSDDWAFRIDDVLDLRSDALLVRWATSGTLRTGGGTFERVGHMLWVFGADGLVARWEQFDVEQAAEALARFDALTAEPTRSERRVRPNAAIAATERLGAAFAAGDVSAYADLFTEDYASLEHPTGAAVSREGVLSSLHAALRSSGPSFRYEHLATLGESLALSRRWWSSEATRGRRFDAGASEREVIGAVEVDERARFRWGEMFAPDRLGDALARLYARYAEILPGGPECGRAAATARSVAVLMGPADPDRWATALAPTVEFTDHRSVGLLGFGRGVETVLRGMRTLLEVADEVANRIDDVIALRSDSLLLRWTNLGTARAGGGAFERQYLQTFAFGSDGLVTRMEWFDADRDAEALARFDALTAEPPRSLHRVRPNAATAHVAREDAEFAARDGDAILSLFAADVEVLDHPIGAALGRPELVASLGRWLRVPDLTRRHVPLATLGDALALCRMSMSSSGVARGSFDVGTYEAQAVVLFEVDAEGRFRRGEIFADDRRGDAICRLYERYAELLPDGRARARAATIARSAAAMLGTPDLDQLASAFAPDIETVDHRSLGTWSARGAEAALQHFRSLLEVAGEIAMREYEVLCLQSDALLVRRTHCGTDRVSGGAYERRFLMLLAFGGGGRIARIEWFEPDDEAEALARFDELTAGPPKSARRVRPNAATAHAARLDATIAARDADALPRLLGGSSEVIDHPSGSTYDRQGVLASWRSLLSARDPKSRHEPLASLGDSLALFRVAMCGSGFSGRTFDVGPYEIDKVHLIEVDAQGRRGREESFAPDRLGDAIVRLYERHAELLPDGPAQQRAAATARSVATTFLGRSSPKHWASAFAPAIEVVDHRTLGTWSMDGAEDLLRNFQAWIPLTDGAVIRHDEILGLQSDVFLGRRTFSGIDRASGGIFERQFIQLCVFGSDGLMTRLEYFETDHDAEALARFDELTAGPPKSARRVRPNAATANLARGEAAIAARDSGALPALFSDDYEAMDHTTGTSWDRQGVLVGWRSLMNARDPISRHEPLATLGDSLTLYHSRTSASEFTVGDLDVGAFERVQVNVMEVDAQGRRRRWESFAANRLGDAVARLYERYAELLPDGPARERAAATARSGAVLARMGATVDPERIRPALAPDLEHVDRRKAGMGSARGVEAFLRGIDALLQISEDFTLRIDDILDLKPNAVLLRVTTLGTGRASGGAFERPILVLVAFGSDGRVSRWEQFDVDCDVEAGTRFDELTAEPPAPAVRIENAAWRTLQRFERAWNERDWDGVVATVAPTHRWDDRRRLVGVPMSTEESFASLRFVFDVSGSRWHDELLATRGERLALFRVRITGQTAGTGPMSAEHLQITEVDLDGRQAAIATFDLDDLDAAYVELDERYLAGEGAPHAGTWRASQRLVRMVSARDWDQAASVLTEDFVMLDHRPLGWGTRSRDEFLAQLRSMVELAPDVKVRSDSPLAVRRDGVLGAGGWIGSRDGGRFEIPTVSVIMLGPDRRIRRVHTYALDALDAARACFEALTADPPAARIENAATRQAARVGEAWAARDWKRFSELYPPGSRFIDRKRVTQLGELDRDRQLEFLRPLFEMSSSRLVLETLATRGDRLALVRVRTEVADLDVGPSETESILINEVDEHGERIATLRFGLEDLDAAYAELDALYHAGEAAPYARVSAGMREFKRAFSERDWDALAARCAPDLVVHDHRLLGWETLHGPAAYVEALRLLVELAPDTKLRIDHATICESGYLVITVWEGTREGGAYEAPSLMVAELDAAGRIRRFDQYDLERLDQAQERFAELRPDPLRIPPNAAARAIDRWRQHTEARDLASVAELLAPSFAFEDRRRLVRDSGDRDKMLASVRVAIASGASLSQTLLATAGERLALVHQDFSISDGGRQLSEIEALLITEVDAEGRIVATVAFDPDDRRGASTEMLERYLRGEGVRVTPRSVIDVVRAMNQHDLVRLRAALPDDYYFHDHRRTGVGRIGNADDYVASLRAVFEQSPDAISDTLYHVAIAEHGSLGIGRMFGTLNDGGGFERLFVRLTVYRDGRNVGTELFELEDLDLARARFEALRPDPLRIPPNAATRATERWRTYAEAHDWDALGDLLAPGFVYEDFRPLVRDSGDREKMLASIRLAVSSGARVAATRLATAGDRLALERLRFSFFDGDRLLSEVETLQIVQVGADGRVVATASFDPDDRRAASAELLARDPHSDAVKRAMGDHDLDRLRAELPDDFVLKDHRRTGLGQLGKDDYLTSLAALFEQAPNVTIETLYTVAVEEHGTIFMTRMFGTLADGGAFESLMLRLAAFRDERIVGLELFEPEDLDAARARFEKLRS